MMRNTSIMGFLSEIRTKHSFRKYILMFIVLCFSIVLTVIVAIHRDELRKLGQYGYLGIFIACLIANSTVFLPSPSTAIVFAFSNIYYPFWVAVLGGLGAAIGEVIGYLLGFTRYQHNKDSRLQGWMGKYGIVTIFIFAFLPLPLFDIAGFLAGTSGMRISRFLIPTMLGKVLKMLVYALLGAKMLPVLAPYIQRLSG